MHGADAPLLAGSVGGIRRVLLITHAGHSGWRTRRPVAERERSLRVAANPDRPVRVRPRGCAEIRSRVGRDLDQSRASSPAGDSTLKPRSRRVYKVNALEYT